MKLIKSLMTTKMQRPKLWRIWSSNNTLRHTLRTSWLLKKEIGLKKLVNLNKPTKKWIETLQKINTITTVMMKWKKEKLCFLKFKKILISFKMKSLRTRPCSRKNKREMPIQIFWRNKRNQLWTSSRIITKSLRTLQLLRIEL